MYRNILSVSIGIFISIIEMIFLIKKVKNLFIEIESIPINKIKILISKSPNEFLIILIIFYFISVYSGGIITAILVKNAKKAYAMLNGFLLFIITMLFIIFFSFPLWFKIITLPLFFLLPCLLGNFIEFFQKKIN